MDHETIQVQVQGPTAVVTMRREEKRNAISMRMRQELIHAFEQLGQDSEVKCIILTGGQHCFCAGVDVKESPGYVDLLNSDLLYRIKNRRNALYHHIEWCPKVTIAAAEGYALGGGFELFLACDLRVAGASAKFGLPEARRATLPGGGASQRLVRELGPALAKELIITGRMLTAAEAKAVGLINYLVDDGRAVEKAKELAREVAETPGVVATAAKWVVNVGWGLPLDYAFDYEAALCTVLSQTKERQERLHTLGKKEATGKAGIE
jgi:enoyl-CoA hydratase